jgi:hypothetical protein
LQDPPKLTQIGNFGLKIHMPYGNPEWLNDPFFQVLAALAVDRLVDIFVRYRNFDLRPVAD